MKLCSLSIELTLFPYLKEGVKEVILEKMFEHIDMVALHIKILYKKSLLFFDEF